MTLDRAAIGVTAWHAGAGYRRMADSFAGVLDHETDVVDRAEALFQNTDWLDRLLAPLVDALAADPWFEPPIRTSRDRLRCGAILFQSPAVTITMSVLSATRLRMLPAPATAVFSGRLGVTKYLRGAGATLQRWRVPPLPEPCLAGAMGRAVPLSPLALTDGMIVRNDGRTSAHAVTAARCDVVTLAATIHVGGDSVAREYDAQSGSFMRMATNDEGAARAQLLLSLLRASDAAGSAAVFDIATRDRAFFLRWSAMREWLAHDCQAAWHRLNEMAIADPHPDIREAALATIAQLSRQAA